MMEGGDRLTAALRGRSSPLVLTQDDGGALTALYAEEQAGERFGTLFQHPDGPIFIGVSRPSNATYYERQTGLSADAPEAEWFEALAEMGLVNGEWLDSDPPGPLPTPPDGFGSLSGWLRAPVSKDVDVETLWRLVPENTPYLPGLEIWDQLSDLEREALGLRRGDIGGMASGGITGVTLAADWPEFNAMMARKNLPFRCGTEDN